MAEEEKATGHARVETSNFLMIVLIFIVVSMGGLVEIVPLFFQHSTTQPIEGLNASKPVIVWLGEKYDTQKEKPVVWKDKLRK